MMKITPIKIVKKYTYEGNDYYLRSITSLISEEILDKAGDDVEELMFGFWKAMLCDETGELLNLTKEEIQAIYPTDMRLDMCSNMSDQATGKKKA